jgi:hypothetical protein
MCCSNNANPLQTPRSQQRIARTNKLCISRLRPCAARAAIGSRCPECGRAVEEALAYFAWDFPPASLRTLRRGVVLALAFFFAFIPALAVFACLSHLESALKPLAWLLPPMLPAMSIRLLTRPWPAMSRRDRATAQLFAKWWSMILIAVVTARFAYEAQSGGITRFYIARGISVRRSSHSNARRRAGYCGHHVGMAIFATC